MRKVAIVGAGFAGLSVCWHLMPYCDVTIFDAHGIGGGASGVATGLLYPFTGRLALRSWLASEGMESTKGLLKVAEEALGRSVAVRSGIYRIVALPVQQKAYSERGREDPEAIWLANVRDKIPYAIVAPGLWIPSGITVFSKLYLEGLWLACRKKGAVLEQTKIETLEQLDAYDAIVLCTGAQTTLLPPIQLMNTGRVKSPMEGEMEPVKGQTLLCRWNDDFASGLVGLGHITPTEQKGLCTVGSTYEHRFLDGAITEEARKELIDKVGAFYPPAHQFEVVSQAAGMRMCPKHGYRPFVGQVAPKVWAFTGLGSRGLLYHAVLGQKLATQVTDD